MTHELTVEELASRLMSAGEAARELGVSKRRAVQLIERGVLPAARVGREYVLRRADVIEARGRKTSPGPEPRDAVKPASLKRRERRAKGLS